jgi:hypothetical protein
MFGSALTERAAEWPPPKKGEAMSFQGSRVLRRSATVVLAAGILAATAAPALAAPAGTTGYHDGGSAPAGTRVTVGDGHGWIERQVDGAAPAGTRVTVGDGYPWVG